jgi:hypothetical protein
MRYTISVQNFRDVFLPRATSAEAVKKAEEMIGDGVAGVQITDTQTNRTYEPDKFHLLMGNKPN